MGDGIDLRSISSSRWTLAFSDPAFERRFQASWSHATRLTTRLWIACGIGFLALFTLMLLSLLPSYEQHHLWTRYMLAIPLIALSQIPMLFPGTLRRLVGPSYLFGSLAAYAMALYCFLSADFTTNVIFLVEMATTFAFCQHYGRIHFRYTLAFTVLASGATIAAIVSDPTLLGVPTAPVIVAILSFAMVGLFAAYTSEFFARRSYHSMRILKAEVARSVVLAEQASVASEAKSRFLAIVGHELRTPLNVIIGYADAMGSGIYGQVENGRVRDAIADIHGSGNRLLAIVNDVIELTNAAQGTVELEESVFDLAALIGELQGSFGSECTDKGIELHVIVDHAASSLSADRRLVRRMVSNLLSNALKYTNKGGIIWLTTGVAGDGALTVRIKDTGIGIAPDKLERAMEVFGQVEDDLNRPYEGIGVGLPLTRSLIELHGGSFAVESEVGKGTKVELTFPAERVVARRAASQTDAA